jgi:hypothetical protein
MRQPALLFLPASQETCHSPAAALSLPAHDLPTLRASEIAAQIRSLAVIEAAGKPIPARLRRIAWRAKCFEMLRSLS